MINPDQAATCCRRAIDRCAYPEVYNGTWNMSLTYATPTLLTRARFYGADPAVGATTGNVFSANYDDHSWNYDVEHVSGLTIRVRNHYQRQICAAIFPSPTFLCHAIFDGLAIRI